MSAVTGVAVAAVEGESAASTAWDRDVKVTMGGRIGSGFAGGSAVLETSGGLFLVGDRLKVALGDGV